MLISETKSMGICANDIRRQKNCDRRKQFLNLKKTQNTNCQY